MSRAGQSVRDGHVFLPPPLLLLLAVAPYLGASRRFPRNVAVVDRREKNRAGGRCSLSAPDTQSHPCTAVPRIGTQNSPGPAFALVHMLRGESEVRPSRHEQPQILSCARIRRYLRAWTSHSICAHMADCACVCTPAEKPARLATPKLRCGSTSITLQVTGYESQPWQHRVAWGALGQLMKPRSLRCRGIPQGEPRTRSSKASAIGPRLHCMRLMSNRYHPPDDLGWHGGWRELAASRIQWDRPSGQGAAAELCGSCPPPNICLPGTRYGNCPNGRPETSGGPPAGAFRPSHWLHSCVPASPTRGFLLSSKTTSQTLPGGPCGLSSPSANRMRSLLVIVHPA